LLKLGLFGRGATRRVRFTPKKRTSLVDRLSPLGADIVQKSKIEQPWKSREGRSLDFSAAALFFNATTKVCDRFGWNDMVLPSARLKRISDSKNFCSPPQKDFCKNICQRQRSKNITDATAATWLMQRGVPIWEAANARHCSSGSSLLIGFDGAYHRFTGKVTIEKFESGVRVECFVPSGS
jgi:hypothetical protein